jgi:hypothetical protein
MHGFTAADGNIFTLDEAFVAQVKGDFVIGFALRVGELPLAAGFPAEPSNQVLAFGVKPANAAQALVVFPFHRIKMTTFVERHQQVVSLVGIALGMILLACQNQAHMAEFGGEFCQFDHRKSPCCRQIYRRNFRCALIQRNETCAAPAYG